MNVRNCLFVFVCFYCFKNIQYSQVKKSHKLSLQIKKPQTNNHSTIKWPFKVGKKAIWRDYSTVSSRFLFLPSSQNIDLSPITQKAKLDFLAPKGNANWKDPFCCVLSDVNTQKRFLSANRVGFGDSIRVFNLKFGVSWFLN